MKQYNTCVIVCLCVYEYINDKTTANDATPPTIIGNLRFNKRSDTNPNNGEPIIVPKNNIAVA